MFIPSKFLVYPQSYFWGWPRKDSCHIYVFCFFFLKKKQTSLIQINVVFKSSTIYWAPSVNISTISVYLERRCPGHYLLPAWQYHQLRRARRRLLFVFLKVMLWCVCIVQDNTKHIAGLQHWCNEARILTGGPTGPGAPRSPCENNANLWFRWITVCWEYMLFQLE